MGTLIGFLVAGLIGGSQEGEQAAPSTPRIVTVEKTIPAPTQEPRPPDKPPDKDKPLDTTTATASPLSSSEILGAFFSLCRKPSEIRFHDALQAPVSVAGYKPHPAEPSGDQRA